MRYLKNENGVAMVTALMLTLIALAITMTLLYMVITNTRMSGAQKRYKSAYEAGYSTATNLYPKDILPTLINNFANYSSTATVISRTTSTFANINLSIASASGSCFRQKISTQQSGWSACSAANRSTDPKTLPDVTFRLQGTGGNRYNIFTKIVDNVPGMSDSSGLDLESGAGVVSPNSNPSVLQQPTFYTFEVQGERETNPAEKAIFEVLYAY